MRIEEGLFMPCILPQTCERALLEQFLRAEAMAMWSVRAAQEQRIPSHVRTFLRRHEADEQRHLQQFENILGIRSHEKTKLPSVPTQWYALAIHLYGYEALGLEFAKVLGLLRPDLTSILEDEKRHVGFFEREIRRILSEGGPPAQGAQQCARAWWRRLPKTLNRYLNDDQLTPHREDLSRSILDAIGHRLSVLGLFERGNGAS